MSKIKLIGSDPELPVYDTVKQEFVSIEGMISDGVKGTKENPLEISEGFSIQEDGVNVEVNPKPASSKQEFIDNHMFMLDAINVFLPDDVVYKVQTSQQYDWKYLGTEQTMEAGCESDICVWNQTVNSKPDITNTNWRFASGHIHCGYDNPSMEQSELMIKKLDLFVGVPSVIFDPDDIRREYYGKAGSGRFKDYGFEARNFSNWWLKNEETIGWMYDAVMEALNTDISSDELEAYREDIEDIINNTNVDKAYDMCDKLGINLEKVKV